ncbi:MAG: hypothetical protein GX167_02805 [Firmicutes bacterium]|jgi:flagellar hook-length control protein FliK|nr:hypothetical protein [Bacillota bacterium]
MNVMTALAPELTYMATAVPESGSREDRTGGFAAVLALLLPQVFPAGRHFLPLQGDALPEKEGASPSAGEPLQGRGQAALNAYLAEQALPAMLATCSLPGTAGAEQKGAGFDALTARKLFLAAALAEQAGRALPGGVAAVSFAAEAAGGTWQAGLAAIPSGNAVLPEGALPPTSGVPPGIAVPSGSAVLSETIVPSETVVPKETAVPSASAVPSATAEAFPAKEPTGPEAQFADSLAAAANREQAELPLPAEMTRQPVLEALPETAAEPVEKAAFPAPEGRRETLPEKTAARDLEGEIRPGLAESLPATGRKAMKQVEAAQAVNAARAGNPSAAAEAPKEGERPGLSTDVLEQVMEKMEFSIRKDGEQKLYVRLKPETLGEVEIRLKLEAGRLTARIVTDNYRVKELLDASLPQINRRLEAQQVTLASFNVTVGQEQNPGRQAESWQSVQFLGQPVEEKQVAGDAADTVAPAGRVNILA